MKLKKILPILLASITIFTVVASYNLKPSQTVATPANVDVGMKNEKSNDQSHENEPDEKSNKVSTKDHIITKNAPKRLATKNQQSEKLYHLFSEPNDPYYSSSWVLSQIKAPGAWSQATDSSGVTVAIIDSGFALNHQDLSASWLLNTGESGDGKETDGIDNDDNGYVDDFMGWDFYGVDNNPQAGETNSSGGGVSHGTEVAGLAGAEGNNNLGVVSSGWSTKLLPLQVMSDDGIGYSSDVAAAIYYAVDNGSDIINMSLGTDGDDPIVREAVDYAFENDVLVIAAAGNCGTSTSGICADQPAGAIMFPANYDRVVAVGALTQSKQRASFSSYGQRLDISAPGSGSLISTTFTVANSTSAYKTTLHGTSYASPIVAGAAALLRAVRPDTSVDDLRALLLATTEKVGSMSNVFYTNSYGHGLLDISRAVEVASDLNVVTEAEPLVFNAGTPTAEKRFKSGAELGAGCKVESGSWCSVWLRNTGQNYDRFLPYQLVNESNESSWTWNASALGRGEWSVRAVQGQTISSTPTLLFSK